jgi:hypothetical protein
MDLLALLRTKAKSIPLGDHSLGLSSVLLHIEVAFGHLARGQSQGEETAYTDAIYRTNLAFEGGVKEAYRVLAQQDPSKKRPFEIEKYLESNKLLRQRILSQFTTYRTEWRNPSSHDYTLDFDEGEALLAIVSVSAFVCVLLDEISEKLASDASRIAAESQRIQTTSENDHGEKVDLLETVASALRTFANENDTDRFDTEPQLMGAIRGYLTVVLPNAEIFSELNIKETLSRVDIIVKRNVSSVFVEVKRSTSAMTLRAGMNQLYAFSEELNSDGILFILGGRQSVQPRYVAHPSHRLIILSSLEQARTLSGSLEDKSATNSSIFCEPETGS